MPSPFAHWLITARAYVLGVLGALTFYAGFQALHLSFITDAPPRPALNAEVSATSERYLRSFGPRKAVTVAVATGAERLTGEAGLAYLAGLQEALATLPGAAPTLAPSHVAISANEHVAIVTLRLVAGPPPDPGFVTDHLAKAGFEETGKGPFRIAMLEPRGPEHERARDRQPMLLMSAACLLMLSAGLLGYTGSFALTGAALVGAGVAAIWQLGLWRLMGGTLSSDALILMVLVAAMALGQAFPFCRQILRSLAGEADDPAAAAAAAWPRTVPFAAASLIASGLAMIALLWLRVPPLSDNATFAAIGLFLAAPAMGLVFPLVAASVAIDRPMLAPGQAPTPAWRKKRRRVAHAAVQQRVREVIAILCAALALVAGLNAGARPLGPVSAGSDALDPALAWSQIADAAAVSPGSPLASFVILGQTEAGTCARFDAIDAVDRLSWQLRNVRGVVTVQALPDALRKVAVTAHGGDLRWSEPPRNPLALVQGMAKIRPGERLYDAACSLLPITISVAGPIDVAVSRVIDTVTAFADANATAPIKFSLAAGPLASAVSEHLAFAEHETAVLLSALLALCMFAFLVLVDWRGAVAMFITFGLTLLALGWTLAVRQIGLTADMAPLALLAALLPLDASIYILSVATPPMRESQHLLWRRAWRTSGRTLLIRSLTVVIAFGAWLLSPDYRQAATGLLAMVATIVATLATAIAVPSVISLIETALDWRGHVTAPQPRPAQS